MTKSYYPIEVVQECCSEYRTGTTVRELCRKHQVPRSTMYYWVKKYADLPNAADIPTKKSLDSMRRAYEKTRQMYEVLKIVNCPTLIIHSIGNIFNVDMMKEGALQRERT